MDCVSADKPNTQHFSVCVTGSTAHADLRGHSMMWEKFCRQTMLNKIDCCCTVTDLVNTNYVVEQPDSKEAC